MPKQTRYTDFLKDPDFIRWQLTSDEVLNTYWQNFIAENPQLKKELQRAISYLKKKGLNKSNLSDDERIELLHKIQHTVRIRKKVKRHTIARYAIAASVAVALLIWGITLFFPGKESSGSFPEEGIIVGELLHSEDIQFISSKEAVSFQNDVEVILNEEGTAEVTQRNSDITTIEVDRDKLNSLIVPFGKRSTLTLADGTRVWLNSGSVLKFPAQFSGQKREIRLTSGEMYIEVAHDKDKPFYVHTPDYKVKVYGTKFNLSNYIGAPHSVVLVEGRIGVQSADSEEQLLQPSEQLLFSDKGPIEKQKVDVTHFTSWKDGYLLLDKTPITDVLERVGRYYNLSFNYEQGINLQDRTCSGKIYLSENLDNVMTTIALLTSTRYEKENNRVYITHETD